jgi:hypothetical protein
MLSETNAATLDVALAEMKQAIGRIAPAARIQGADVGDSILKVGDSNILKVNI